MKKSERGMADKTAIVIGLIFGLVMVGFFRANNGILSKVNYKAALRLPCGLTYGGVSDGDKITFPMSVTGYINGCGWDQNELRAGTVQIFDARGFPVTVATDMKFTDNGKDLPLPFISTLRSSYIPHTENGQLVFRSNSGLIKMVPVNF